MRRISIKGVLIGGVVDVSASMIAGILFAIAAVAVCHVFGRVPHKTVFLSLPFRASLIAIGLAGSAFGGFVAAWLARHDELLNAALSSYLCVSVGIYGWSSDHSAISTKVLLMISGPIFSVLGGYLRRRKTRAASAH